MKPSCPNGDTAQKEIPSAASNETVTVETTKPKKKKLRKALPGICLANCRYDAVRRCAKRLGFREMNENDQWTVYWTDCSVSVERCTGMKIFQRINHFPGMSEICRKDLLSRNLTRMLKSYPKEYAFFPRTWVLPADQADMQSYMKSKKKAAFICKPQRGCQGKGIFITRQPIKESNSLNEKYVVQQYLDKPLLIDGFKFDLRVYVLVTSFDPLRVYVYHEGLARFATTPYCELTNSNISQHCMHLTNYSINKYSADYDRDDRDDAGSKRKFSSIKSWFASMNLDYNGLWAKIDDIIIKTLIAAHPIISHSYRTCFSQHNSRSGCFEILGFDILIDRKLKPWILEVNHSPSFHTDSPLDKEIKEGLLYDTLNMLHVKASDRTQAIFDDKRKTQQRLTKRAPKSDIDEETRQLREEQKSKKILEETEKWETKTSGGFRRIYPIVSKTNKDNQDKYRKYFDNTVSLLQTTASQKAREEAAKAFRLNLEAKNDRFKKNDRGEAGGGSSSKTNDKMKNKTARNKIDTKVEEIDQMKPARIAASEEMERQRLLKQRYNLFRDIGGVDFVYRVLHCTRGTTTHTHQLCKSLSAYEFQAAQDIRRRCTDMRCPVRHRELTNYVQSETALVSRARTAMTTARSSAYLKQQSLSSVSAVLGPTTVLRQRPFSFVKELNNAFSNNAYAN